MYRKFDIFIISIILCFAGGCTYYLPPGVLAEQYLLAAINYADANKYKKAMEYFDKILALQTNPETKFFYYYGKTLYYSGEYEKAGEYLKKYITFAGKEGKVFGEAWGLLDTSQKRAMLVKEFVKLAKKHTLKPHIRRYIIYNNGVIYDRKTKYEWFVGPDKNIYWHTAKHWVEALGLNGGGWRMPTINELKSLYVEGAGAEAITPFLGDNSDLIWVWSAETAGRYRARFFAFYDGSDGWCRVWNAFDLRVFAVRSAIPE